jgi:hypothetical protein
MVEPLRKTKEELSKVLLHPTAFRQLVKSAPPEEQAYQALHFGFTVAPIVAGADKFFDFLGNWDNYLAPVVPKILGVAPHTFMMGVGVIEIIAGIGVALRPKIFGYVVSAWLCGIIVNLLVRGAYYDVALRDLGLVIGAFALARLAAGFERRPARI